MKKYPWGIIFEWLMRILGWGLFLVFLYMFTWPFIDCPLSKCNGTSGIAYVLVIYAFVFPLPPAIVCLVIARGMKLFRQYKKDKAAEGKKP